MPAGGLSVHLTNPADVSAAIAKKKSIQKSKKQNAVT